VGNHIFMVSLAASLLEIGRG